MNRVTELKKLGQSLWYDQLSRNLLTTGELRRMIARRRSAWDDLESDDLPEGDHRQRRLRRHHPATGPRGQERRRNQSKRWSLEDIAAAPPISSFRFTRHATAAMALSASKSRLSWPSTADATDSTRRAGCTCAESAKCAGQGSCHQRGPAAQSSSSPPRASTSTSR